ncbi:Clathrin heavy chain 2 [Talaromyces islandicus]|uniref:Clathrin heavy chain 2 n=1 Tax=Talaromyces islandicus TaxID=28573 RepID=A0A0U1M7W6_TALIS|nr:Clathrin heavy chain 2 [Talaromyces islandicus]
MAQTAIWFDHTCVICGLLVVDREPQSPEFWLSQYRIIYCEDEKCALSGVGVYSREFGNVYLAPSNPESRRMKSVDEPNPSDTGIEGSSGFVFHESCWEILRECFKPQEFSIPRLWDVCRSMPPFDADQVVYSLLDGSGYYGYPISIDVPPEDFVWKDALIEKKDNSLADPYNLPLMGYLLEMVAEEPLEDYPFSAISNIPTKPSIMERLPKEICDEIASLLSTSDLANLRLASRSFVDIYRNQSVWASRFTRPSGDRYWLFETREMKKKACDWRRLYTLTSDTYSPMVFSNRKRVWTAVNLIKDIMDMTWIGNIQELSINATCDEQRQKVDIPVSVRRICFSFAKLSKISYITGIGFTSSEGVVNKMGYWANNQALSVEVTGFKGFTVALDSYGLRAIQVNQDQNRVSDWVGCPDDCPKTMNLVTSGNITALEVQYDGWKIVGIVLDINGRTAGLPAENRSRRETDVWYPDILEEGLFISGYGYNDLELAHMDYPTYWVLFGGRGGIYLRNLIKITGTIEGNHISLKFTYNTDRIPVQNYELGPIKGRIDVDFTIINFPIDGPGGEVVTALDVYTPEVCSDRWPYLIYGFEGKELFPSLRSQYKSRNKTTD